MLRNVTSLPITIELDGKGHWDEEDKERGSFSFLFCSLELHLGMKDESP